MKISRPLTLLTAGLALALACGSAPLGAAAAPQPEIDSRGADAIVLVEWAERSDEVVAQATARITLAVPPGGNGRTATVEFSDGRAV